MIICPREDHVNMFTLSSARERVGDSLSGGYCNSEYYT